jgi:hypothetical protein
MRFVFASVYSFINTLGPKNRVNAVVGWEVEAAKTAARNILAVRASLRVLAPPAETECDEILITPCSAGSIKEGGKAVKSRSCIWLQTGVDSKILKTDENKQGACSTYADHHIQQFQRRPGSGWKES